MRTLRNVLEGSPFSPKIVARQGPPPRSRSDSRTSPLRLVVDRIRDAIARVMAGHLRERHRELRVGETCHLGEVLDHFRVTPNRE